MFTAGGLAKTIIFVKPEGAIRQRQLNPLVGGIHRVPSLKLEAAEGAEEVEARRFR